MRRVLNLLTLIILAVLVVSLVMRGDQTARVINAVTGFFQQSYSAILGTPTSSPATPARRVVRRRVVR